MIEIDERAVRGAVKVLRSGLKALEYYGEPDHWHCEYDDLDTLRAYLEGQLPGVLVTDREREWMGRYPERWGFLERGAW